MTKPASAPPAADALQEVVAEMRAYVAAGDPGWPEDMIGAWADRLAASAQVRAVEAWQPASAGDRALGRNRGKPAPKPVPVAQGDAIKRWALHDRVGVMYGDADGAWVDYDDHARTVAELRAELSAKDEAYRLQFEACARLGDVEASLAACRADAERLDYLIATGKRISRTDGGRYRVMGLDGISEWQTEKDTGRAAIDAAIKEPGNG